MRIRFPAPVLAAGLLSLSAGTPPATGTGTPLPICDAGPAQLVDCTGPFTFVQLDGTNSIDPLGIGLRYRWEICGDPRVTIDNELGPTPMLTFNMQGICTLTCDAFLIVTNDAGKSVCSTTITVSDMSPPVITCPPNIAIGPNDPIDPTNTGFATAVDNCNPAPVVSFTDIPIGKGIIRRRWTAFDGCRTSECFQELVFVGPGFAHYDILPGACPNGLDVTSLDGLTTLQGGVIGNAIDVTTVDLSTVAMSRLDTFTEGGPGPVVFPISATLGDVGTPFIGDPLDICDCAPLGPDGTTDADLIFDEQEVIDVLGLANEPNGTVVTLLIRGLFLDGTPFEGVDCVVISNTP